MLKPAIRIFAAILLLAASVFAQNAPTSGDGGRSRLAELNSKLRALEAQAEQIAAERKLLEAERERLLVAIAASEAEESFKTTPAKVIYSVDGANSVTIYVDGQKKPVRLAGYVPTNWQAALDYLKKELVGGTAYVRCAENPCAWVYLYLDRDKPSLNEQIVSLGYGSPWDSIKVKKAEDGAQSPSGTTATTPQTTADPPASVGSSKSQPGTDVQVKGYYRKDGTYVRPHTRSAPRRKP